MLQTAETTDSTTAARTDPHRRIGELTEAVRQTAARLLLAEQWLKDDEGAFPRWLVAERLEEMRTGLVAAAAA